MPLSHVLMWTEKHGYRPVKEATADRVYPKTVSARTGTFICEICNQYVTFTAGDVRVRHFRHSSAAENKFCEDRSVQYGDARTSYGFRQNLRTLPLRLVQVRGGYRLEIGLLALSEEHLARYSGQLLRIEGQRTYAYAISERFLPDRLTWLDVGDVPAKYYCLSLSDDSSLPPRYPRQVDGVDDVTLFDSETGKRLPPFSTVEVGREYLVAIHRKPDWVTMEDVRVTYLPPQEHGWKEWNLYRIQAIRFSKATARFFLQFQVTLTKQAPPNIFPLWPAFVRTPHLIYHETEELFIFIEGEDVQIYLFPTGTLSAADNVLARLIHFTTEARKQMKTDAFTGQLLEVGLRSHMLRYDYFVRRVLDQTASRPEVMVMDQHGTVLQEDRVKGMPSGGMVQISASFDGEVWLERDGFLADRRELKGGEKLALKVNRGQVLTIFQGLDRIRSILFVRPSQKQNKGLWDDILLCRRLRRLTGDEMPNVHLLDMAIRFFREYRATSAWLRTRKAEGRISARALTQLRALMKD